MNTTTVTPDHRDRHAAYDADVSAILVNYNGLAYTNRTIDTLLASQPTSSVEIIVVDNASTDGSVEVLAARYPNVRWIRNSRNLGLAPANNQGIEAARGRYIFVVNNDTIVLPGTVDRLVEYLDAQPNVGAAGSKVLNPDGTIQGTVKNSPTPMVALFGRESILTRLFPNNRFSREYLVYETQDFSQPFAAHSVSCCAVMVRREAIERAGAMDSRYFVYWCDVDWCRAIWGAGFEVHCVPDSQLIHDEHQGGRLVKKPRSWRMLVDFHKGAYRYYRKWHVRHWWEPLNIVAIVGLTLRTLTVAGWQHLLWRLKLVGVIG